ncbi:hypothetical protein [Pyrobaculum aerophilum]|uniref:Uncharacterized protein n=1 Tax=Pyrobaculum aerophilum TaxID=13773 RepID=A0A371R2C9_9CREN|nr:hypothetical protein [Pyrobaculum aerophilum]RFA97673.1 hypothetical protein CGL51_02015 [Pyrobaculum aerophilum]RFA99484.1 hypothetical protein CGL52_02780 [Pyrobaculum aerophilum]
MCEVTTSGDAVIFTGPELERTMAYLIAKPLTERIEIEGEALRITPALPEVVGSLQALCKSDVSTLLLDIKESLLHLGWLVEGRKDVVRIRKSRRAGTSGFTSVEYEKSSRRMTVVTTQKCLANSLRRLGFEVVETKYLVEAAKQVSTLVEAIELEEAISQEVC